MSETTNRTEAARLKARLERERRIRVEAETIAERALRDLYDKQQALVEESRLRQELELQFRQAQKMEAIGRLAGGVAHDFNNLLTIIVGMSETIRAALGPDDTIAQCAAEIRTASERAAALTRQLLAFSRRQVLAPAVLNLNAVVTELQRMLSYLVGMDIDVQIALEPTLRPVKADSGQLEQVLTNLVVNARDAMPKGGKLLIETRNVDFDSAYVERHPEVRPGPYVMLAVTDTGGGLDAETKTRLFEPFFTTKEMGRGTGLGLAVVYGIVKQSSGHIWVYSEPDRGTTFRIYLPQATESQRADRPVDDTSGPVRGGTETVLVVEDEPALLMLASSVLVEHGYSVLQALDGQQALALAHAHDGPIHLILADVVLPGLKGPQVCERIKSIRPGIKVMFMSGYTDNALGHHHGLAVGAPFLQKPFTPDGLSRYVRQVLDIIEDTARA